MSKLKRNIVYSSILTCANYIFPLITYPYASRVLGVANIGICNFADSIVNYFVMFSMMGMATIGIREIAACNGDRARRERVFNDLFWLNGLFTVIAILALCVSVMLVPKLYTYKTFLFLGCIKIMANFFSIEWFFRGIEDFKYITDRSIVVKLLYVIGVFVFVKGPSDIVIYFFLTTSFIYLTNGIINFSYSHRYVHLRLTNVHVFSYFKPFLIIGLYTFLTSMYTSFNVAFLGFVSDVTEVGFYTTATKIFILTVSLYSAFTGVMMPRMSSLLSTGNIDEFKNKLGLSVELLFAFGVPAALLGGLFAPEIIRIVSGKGYEGAILPMRAIMPLMIIEGYGQIMVIQTLMPMHKDKAILYNSVFGALLGVILNIAIVPWLHSLGSAIVWVSSEFAILLSSQYFVHKYISMGFPLKKLLRYVLFSLPPFILCFVVRNYMESYVLNILAFLLALAYYGWAYLFILRLEPLRKILRMKTVVSK